MKKRYVNKIINKMQEILIDEPTQTKEFAMMRTGLELGATYDDVKEGVESYRMGVYY